MIKRISLLFFLELIFWGCEDKNESCPAIYSPVCGSDGLTYGNDCYARNAGVKEWTIGVCNCIDVSKITDDYNCDEVYEPVCGCNKLTYSNQCYAENAGVTDWTQGECN